MMSIISSHHCNWSTGAQSHLCRGRCDKVPCSGHFVLHSPYKGLIFSNRMYPIHSYFLDQRKRNPVVSSTVNDGQDPDNSEDESSADESSEGVDSQRLKENLERIVGTDDSAFSGIDLATLIRNKYGRSYDVQLIKKEFMGKNLLALNVMWKFMEQKSFPLTEEEYILRLDDVANTLRCWGAVSHIRNSLAKLKERPRIGKAVSIFIDMDESGGRANEWIYK